MRNHRFFPFRRVISITAIGCLLLWSGSSVGQSKGQRCLSSATLVLSGMPIQECGLGQWIHEYCRVKNGISAGSRRRAFAALGRRGIRAADVKDLEDSWMGGYMLAGREARTTKWRPDCVVERRPKRVKSWVGECVKIRIVGGTVPCSKSD